MPAPDTFESHFKKPMRMALYHLRGIRFAASLRVGIQYLGTGPYVIEEKDGKGLLTKNPYFAETVGFERIEAFVIPSEQAKVAIETGKIDVYDFAQRALSEECNNPNLGCVRGVEASHEIISVNGLPGRIFGDSKNRSALLKLISENFPKQKPPQALKSDLFNLDFQLYLPLQAGRLNYQEAMSLIQNKFELNQIRSLSQKNPVKVVGRESVKWLTDFLEENGIKTIDQVLASSDFYNLLYHTSDADLVVGSASVFNGDPDGIYHALGEHGAIRVPMEARPKIAELLEQGRGGVRAFC